jgi:DNA-binding CsgD family transcriptional regulator
VRGELRCRWAAAEAFRRAGETREAKERLLSLELELETRDLNVLLRRVRRSLRLVGVRRAAVRTKAGALTGREAEVIGLVADGLSNAEIARRLAVGRPTVERIVASASQKLRARTRVQAAVLAAAARLTSWRRLPPAGSEVDNCCRCDR